MSVLTRPARAVPGVLVVIGGLALGHVVLTVLPTDAGLDAPFEVEGALGEALLLREAEVTVTDVTRADEVSVDGRPYTTSGQWVVATYEVRALEGVTTSLAAPRLLDGAGRTWSANTRVRETCPAVAPGLMLTCTTAVEVPEGTGPATLRLAPQSDDRADAEAVVALDIGLLPANETGDPIELAPPQVVGEPGEGTR